jgi:ribosome-associated toxin RatA of RatAB toxin-antitoxin module
MLKKVSKTARGVREMLRYFWVKGLPMKTININASQVVAAPLDRVWDIVADVDNDPKYYSGLNDIRNISKDGNKIEREVTVGFLKHKARQTIILNPKTSVELKMTQGPIQGTRVTTLSKVDEGKTRIEVMWSFTPSGVPDFVHDMVKSEISKGTKEALQKFANELEHIKPRATTGEASERLGSSKEVRSHP